MDGFVAGSWRLDQRRSAAMLSVAPFARLPATGRDAVEAEGAALLDFAAPTADHELVWAGR